eukprot:gene6549-4722_t
MQVNKAIFPATFPHFEDLLKSCDFYAFDAEMTGITLPDVTENATFAPERSYDVKRQVAARYGVIQVGICLFHKDASPHGSPVKYVARPFNFILFPDQTDNQRAIIHHAREIAMSPSAIAFLRRNHMDFQSWIYDGISYCDEAQEKKLREWMAAEKAAKEKQSPPSNLMELSSEDTKWVAEALTKAEALQSIVEALKEKRPTAVTDKEAVLSSPPSKLAEQKLRAQIQERAANVELHCSKFGPARLKILAPEAKKMQEQKNLLVHRRALYDILGFRLVFEALVNSKKTCVGHNCLADILFLMASLDNPLPVDLIDGKNRMRRLFPKIYDTKYLSTRSPLCCGEPLESNYLGGLFERYGLVSDTVQVELPLGFQSYDSISLVSGRKGQKNLAHEAGYDALMTGAVFLNMVYGAGYTLATIPKECVNKVALFGSLFALNLQQKEDEYVPPGYSVLELEHLEGLERDQISRCLEQLASGGKVHLHTIDKGKSLAVVPPSMSGEALLKKIRQRSDSSILSAKLFPRPDSPTPLSIKRVGLMGRKQKNKKVHKNVRLRIIARHGHNFSQGDKMVLPGFEPGFPDSKSEISGTTSFFVDYNKASDHQQKILTPCGCIAQWQCTGLVNQGSRVQFSVWPVFGLLCFTDFDIFVHLVNGKHGPGRVRVTQALWRFQPQSHP